ncbi:NAD-dependent epimerase/dehydratase [Actinopolyspora erythraea]|uniref:NAD-dependent epimerase/dehydratase n=1 Tax=Actinopolyspora erythraea TaxID=414996 RepID=A0A096ZP63_9ACTN|nr:NAD-dependent epimerase/dehydratase [Actinopolyspora erythraea]AIS23795.1 TDP-4-keto-6-deoxyhexose 4-ketoreductase [Actinopolyspora erythraea]ASU79084.1 NAD-dependent epimerase/dehydratase [Actinopolyspora erythraea]
MIALLGASGFIGNAVLRELRDRPARLRAVSTGGTPDTPPGAAEVEELRTDLLQPGRAAAAIEEAEVIVHLVAHATGGSTWRSATSDPESERVNVGLIHDLVSALRQQRRSTPPVLLYASTAQAATVSGASRYAQQKREAERILREATDEGLVRGVILRLPTIYGQSGPAGPTGRGVVAAMIRRALAGQPLTMWHNGDVRRDLLHVEDVANAFATALDHHDALAGGTWPLGADRSEPLGDIFRTISGSVARHTGTPAVDVVTVPPPEHAEANDFRSDDIDSSEFRTRTGWHPRVALADGIDRTVTALLSAQEQ